MVFETYDLGEKRTVSRGGNIRDLSSDGSYVRMIVSDALTEQNNYDVVFSYLHNIDALSHNFLMYCKNHPNFLADKNVFKALWRKFTKILTYISGS